MASRSIGVHLARVAGEMGYSVEKNPEGAPRPFRVHLKKTGREARREFRLLMEAGFNFNVVVYDYDGWPETAGFRLTPKTGPFGPFRPCRHCGLPGLLNEEGLHDSCVDPFYDWVEEMHS